MKPRKAILIAGFLLLGLLVFAHPGEAADCYRSGGAYVCDARQQLPTFTAPDRQSGSLFLNRTYSWLEDHAPLYAEPRPGAEIVEEGTVGILYYTIEETTTDGAGNTWYKVADGQWARAENMHFYDGTRFAGVRVNRTPERPFGWVLQRFQPAPGPDAEPPEDAPWIGRYTFIEIHDAAEGEDGWVWFDVGGGQWVKQTFLSLVDVSPRPEDVGQDEYWVEVDLFEQVFAAYEGDRMVYAGLVSSGLDGWDTNEGLFSVYARHREWPMWGGEVGEDYYYLQDVPHTMFFDNEIALHGAYWHDGFGAQRSHGCVNMPPRDAQWVYYWSEQAPNDLHVWVHSSPQDYFLQKYEDVQATAYASSPLAP